MGYRFYFFFQRTVQYGLCKGSQYTTTTKTTTEKKTREEHDFLNIHVQMKNLSTRLSLFLLTNNLRKEEKKTEINSEISCMFFSER